MLAMQRFCLAGSLLVLCVVVGCDRTEPLAPDLRAAGTAGSGPNVNPPSGTNAVAGSYNQISVSWNDNSSNETGVEVHRSTAGASGPFTLVASTGPNGTSYGDGGLTGSTQYCYEIRAFRTTGNKRGYSAFSNVACATTLATPVPAAPSGVSASPRFGYAITTTWTDNSTNETGFRVERAATSTGPWTAVGTTGSNVTASDDYQFPGTEQPVCYRVIALSSFGDSGPSAVDCTTMPAAPSVVARVREDGTVDLSWTDNSGVEDTYEVQRGGGGAENMTVIATLPANATSYTDVGLIDGYYGYSVRATKDGGTSSNSIFVQAVVATVVPNAQANVDAAPYGSSAVFVTWVDQATNEESTRLERSTDGGFSWETVDSVGWYFAPSSLWDGSRSSEQQVCYRVIASNRVGDSPPSNTDCTTPPAAPTGFIATVVDSQTVDFAWTDNSAVEDGHLIGIDYGYGYWEFVAWVGPNTTSFRLEAYTYALYQTYFVVATKDGGYSDWSNSVYVTPAAGSSAVRAGSTSRMQTPPRPPVRRRAP